MIASSTCKTPSQAAAVRPTTLRVPSENPCSSASIASSGEEMTPCPATGSTEAETPNGSNFCTNTMLCGQLDTTFFPCAAERLVSSNSADISISSFDDTLGFSDETITRSIFMSPIESPPELKLRRQSPYIFLPSASIRPFLYNSL